MSVHCQYCQDASPLGFEFDFAFQPIFDLDEGNVYAYEALVRGTDGQGAAWVLDQVKDENRHLFDQEVRRSAVRKAHRLGLTETDARLSINFDPRAVIQALRCLRHSIDVAEEVSLPFERVLFEFSEYARLDKRHIKRIVSTYHKVGFKTAIDDFGAGHSGLNALANLNTDVVKIDMGLIRGIDRDRDRATIVKGALRMLEALDRTVVVEGIETQSEFETLRAMGVAKMQGFYLGMPELDVLQTEPSYLEPPRLAKAS